MKALFLVMGILNIFMFLYIADRTSVAIIGKALLTITYFGMALMWLLEFVSAWTLSRRELSPLEREADYTKMIQSRIGNRSERSSSVSEEYYGSR